MLILTGERFSIRAEMPAAREADVGSSVSGVCSQSAVDPTDLGMNDQCTACFGQMLRTYRNAAHPALSYCGAVLQFCLADFHERQLLQCLDAVIPPDLFDDLAVLET